MQENPLANNNASPEPSRLTAARAWAASELGLGQVNLVAVSGDASFRRYFRLQTGARTLILMDAPPAHENSGAFIEVAGRLRQAGLRAPEIVRFDLEQGFGLLEDLGDQLYRDLLTPSTVERYWPALLQLLSRMASRVEFTGLPKHDDSRLQEELDLFIDWYLLQHRQMVLTGKRAATWQTLCATLKQSAADQPQVFVHRDFHSCNLLFQPGKDPGIIDFQDAVQGPVSYDFISLLWDRYIAWPRAQLEGWMESYRKLLRIDIDQAGWIRWCDLMGLQRNLKIVGIFARLHYRDQKPGYLQMIPAFYRYLRDVVERYPEFHDFKSLLETPECAP